MLSTTSFRLVLFLWWFLAVIFDWFLAVIFGTCVFLVMVLSGVVMTFWGVIFLGVVLGVNFPWGWFLGYLG